MLFLYLIDYLLGNAQLDVTVWKLSVGFMFVWWVLDLLHCDNNYLTLARYPECKETKKGFDNIHIKFIAVFY